MKIFAKFNKRLHFDQRVFDLFIKKFNSETLYSVYNNLSPF